MARSKYDHDEDVQAYAEKKVQAALKDERKRVAAVLRDMPPPAFGSKKEANALMKDIKMAVAA
jgi:hypothetical protein